MITKKSILTDLITNSSKECPLSKSYFFYKYSDKETDPFVFSSQLGSMIHDLQCDQIDAQSSSRPFHLIFESDQGYYIARNREDALIGNYFNLSKLNTLYTISSNYSRMIQKAFPAEDPAQLNLI